MVRVFFADAGTLEQLVATLGEIEAEASGITQWETAANPGHWPYREVREGLRARRRRRPGIRGPDSPRERHRPTCVARVGRSLRGE